MRIEPTTGLWLLGACGVAAMVVVLLTAWGRMRLSWVQARMRQLRRPPIATALSFAPVSGQFWCAPSMLGTEAATQIHGAWRVNNSSRRDVQLVSARLADRDCRHAAVFTRSPQQNAGQEAVFAAGNVIPALTASEVTATLFVVPPIATRAALASDVVFRDAEGTDHHVYGAWFRPLPTPRPQGAQRREQSAS